MESGRVMYADARNIPHMQLFHHLKQKFPDLRDNDVNESIHKYGLDRERCEEELSQRTQIHPGGYYGPWGRASPAASRLTSPVRGSTPTTPTTPLLGATSPGVVAALHPGQEYLVYNTGGGAAPLFTSPPAFTAPAPLFYPAGSLVSYGWHPGVTNATRQPQDGPARLPPSRDTTRSRSTTPSTPRSAPPIPNSFDPFSHELPERRHSVETTPETRPELEARLPGLHLSPPLPRPAMDPPAGLAATATATTTITTTTSTSTFAPLTITTTTTTTPTSSTTINCTNLSPVDGGSSSSSSSRGSSGGDGSSSSSSGRPPPVLIQEQLARKDRLSLELGRQVDEKGRLEAEVEMMVRELHAREHQRKHNADTNTMRIEEVQQENQRLQSDCYEMENKILRLAPDYELESYSNLTPQPAFPEGAPIQPPPQLTRGSSGSSLGSELGTPNTPNTPHTPHTPLYLPTRPAPPPPTPPPPPVPNHGYCQYQVRGGERVEEPSHKWGCSKCTFINHPDMNMCEMCDFPRFTIGTTPPRQAASTPPHHQGPCYCHRHHQQHTTGPPAGSPRVAAVVSQHTASCSSLPLSQGKPSLTNILKDKLSSFRDRRSDSV